LVERILYARGEGFNVVSVNDRTRRVYRSSEEGDLTINYDVEQG
jgi:hypothetical protein